MNKKLSDYLSYFRKQKETGLVIIETENLIAEIKNQITEHNFALTNSWQEALVGLKNQKSVCLLLDENFAKNHYDLITQYFARAGYIQIMDKETMKLFSVQFDPFKCHLLLLTSNQSLFEIEKNYSIKDKVGLVERI